MERPRIRKFFFNPYGIIILVGIVVTLPLIVFGLPFYSHDGVPHFIYYSNFASQLWNGEVYPRWLTGINGGYGGPTFFIYPPLSYFITSIFGWLPTSAWHHLGLSASIALIFSGLTSFIWLKEISPARPAACAAILYMLLPYHLIYDIYARAAFAESYTFVWMPLILFFVTKLKKKSRVAFFGIALTFAALCSTHLLTTLMFGVVPVLYAFVRSPSGLRLRSATIVVAAMAFGVGLTAAFVIPALAYQDFVYLYEAFKGDLYFANWLITHKFYEKGSLKDLWMAPFLTAIACLCFVLSRDKLRKEEKQEARFWLATTLCTMTMMTYLSYPVWLLIFPLQKVQFAWRFNTVLCVAALPLFAFGISCIRRPFTKLMLATMAILSCLVAAAAIDISVRTWRNNIRSSPPRRVLSRELQLDQQQDTHPNWPRTVTFGLSPETQSFGLPDLELKRSEIPHENGLPVTAFISSGSGSIEGDRIHARRIKLKAASSKDFTVTVTQFYFPGWTARIAGSLNEIPIDLKTDLGLIGLDLPPGEHNIELTLDKLPAEIAGEWISILSALIFLLLAAYVFSRGHKRQTGHDQ